MTTRPALKAFREARQRIIAAIEAKEIPVLEDLETVVGSIRPLSPREIDEMVDRLRVDQYDAEKIVRALLGKP